MVERICPQCGAGNPLNDRFCGKCGTTLERLLPAPRSSSPLVRLGAALPVPWKDVGRTLAVGAAALVAEAGIAWLRRRIEQGGAQSGSAAAPLKFNRSAGTSAAREPSNVVTIISERVIELVDRGDGDRRLSERTVWRRIEE